MTDFGHKITTIASRGLEVRYLSILRSEKDQTKKVTSTACQGFITSMIKVEKLLLLCQIFFLSTLGFLKDHVVKTVIKTTKHSIVPAKDKQGSFPATNKISPGCRRKSATYSSSDHLLAITDVLIHRTDCTFLPSSIVAQCIETL